MPPRASNNTGHIHKKRRPVSTISNKETSLLLAPHQHDSFPEKIKSSITWGQPRASLPYHEEEYHRAITIPHPRYHPTPEKGYEHIPDTLDGVPLLSDQVEFFEHEGSQGRAVEQPGRRGSFKGMFEKVLGKREYLQMSTTAGTSYPAELVGMTVAEKQTLASQARQHYEPSLSESTKYRDHYRPRKSVSWDPKLGSLATSSSGDIPETVHHSHSPTTPLIPNTEPASSGRSVASDKTIWPFTCKPASLSGGRSRKLPKGREASSFDVGVAQGNDMEEDGGAREPQAFKGFEFTPRQYVPLWTPAGEITQSPLEHHTTPPPTFALPTTPPAQQPRHRRSLSISNPHWKPPSSQTTGNNYPPAFMDPQLSPSLAHTLSGRGTQAWPPSLPPFGAAKVYTPPSPYDHSIASFSAHQGLQTDLGTPTGKWSRVDFGNRGRAGVVASSAGNAAPSRTLMYAAEDWLRTQ
ncbi:hypothetical protein QFC22_004077 [Naganishia vaughanmartiniae]|uniref:Uncharacterized protein n=1 Tax=Naganishia vaughanmartiniae TaxID=1424756 RepID=A0ACC2X395_9TREE|nr:hypothetical protein QFC22_004077 [Naganishia vaughanmartiniae]